MDAVVVPRGMKEKFMGAGHHVVRDDRYSNTVLIGGWDSSLECIEDCRIGETHGFPKGVTTDTDMMLI